MRQTPNVKATHAANIVNELSDMLISDILEKDTYVGRQLGVLRDAIWNTDYSNMSMEEQMRVKHDTFNTIMEKMGDDQKKLLVESYAKMGNLYEIAAISARSNYFADNRNSGRDYKQIEVGGAADFITEYDEKVKNRQAPAMNVDEWIEKLNQPVFEMTFTAHPTNVNGLESMNAQRNICKALEDYKAGSVTKEVVQNAVKKYIDTPLLHKGGENLTVQDETKNTLYFLSNIYEDLPESYARYDAPLAKKATKDGNGKEYDPTALNLQLRLGAWGSSGDKDGNKNVTAETTLEAIAMHTQAALENYSKDLANINSPELDNWKTSLAGKKEDLEPLLTEIADLRADASNTMRINGILSGATDAVYVAKEKLSEAQEFLNNQTESEGISTWTKNVAKYQDDLKKAEENLPKAQAKFEAEKDSRKAPNELNERFDKLSARLARLREGLDSKKFEDDIKAAYEQNHDQATLDLLRRERVFGFNFGKIEYRETAEEYARVVEELVKNQVPEYASKTPEEKAAEITKLLQDPENIAAKSLAAMQQEIIENGAGKAYSEESATPIAYHTIKRMALARDFSDMIKDNVLAECGQLDLKDAKGNKIEPTEAQAASQGVANFLEAEFLQKAVEDKNGNRAKLGIVPLFEEPDTMKHIDKIMGAVYDNPAYKDQLKLLQGDAERPTQQVQIAHSDNARRSGLQAARAYIHEAHKKIAELNEKREINTEFFEGGSVSDAYRNGVRAISANVESFGLYKFAKMTFQGGDLLNYFNHPDSTARLIYRQFSHQAEGLEKIGDDWHAKPASSKQNEAMDGVAITALKAMLNDYQKNDFTQDKMGSLLGVLDYNKEVANSNASSRAGGRGVAADKPISAEAKEKLVQTIDKAVAVYKKIEKIGIDKVRTIGFSKAWQNNGIIPSWIGSINLRDELAESINEKYHEINGRSDRNDDERTFLELVNSTQKNADGSRKKLSKDDRVELNSELINAVYKNSNTFRDAQDRSIFALALSDMNAANNIIDTKLKRVDPNDTPSQNIKGQAMVYLERIKSTFDAAASLAYEAKTGKEFTLSASATNNEKVKNNETEELIINALPNLNGEFERKKGYNDFIMYIRSEHPELFDDPNLARTIICAGDTVNHGRWLGASDNSYIMERLPNSALGR